MKARRHTALRVLAAVLGLLVVLTGAATVLAWTYPSAARSAYARMVVWNPGLSDVATPFARAAQAVVDRAQQGYEHRIAPLLAGRRPGQEATRPPAPSLPETGFPETGCDECHEGWRTRYAFSVVYMPHDRHAASGVGCSSCHAASGFARDVVPAMKGCAGCHAEAKDGSKKCGTCHPPGSLFHGAALAGSRTIGYECSTCHNPRSVSQAKARTSLPAFDRRVSACADCHSEPSCSRCHPASHERGYAHAHPRDMRTRKTTIGQCRRCHESSWCADRCHARRGRG